VAFSFSPNKSLGAITKRKKSTYINPGDYQMHAWQCNQYHPIFAQSSVLRPTLRKNLRQNRWKTETYGVPRRSYRSFSHQSIISEITSGPWYLGQSKNMILGGNKLLKRSTEYWQTSQEERTVTKKIERNHSHLKNSTPSQKSW
jgi:hypothetical protein